jgi:hypothetical protein
MVGALVVTALLIGTAIAVGLITLLPLLGGPAHTPDAPAVVPAAGRGFGGGTLVGGAFLLFLLLIPFYLIGFALILCCCGCKGGLRPPPLPVPPDFTRLGEILRGIAAQLAACAETLESADTVAVGVRDELTNSVIDLSRPTIRTHEETFDTVLFGAVTVTVLDGVDWESVFSDDQKQTLRAFGDSFGEDANGQTPVGNTAQVLRAQAASLKQQASALDGRPS